MPQIIKVALCLSMLAACGGVEPDGIILESDTPQIQLINAADRPPTSGLCSAAGIKAYCYDTTANYELGGQCAGQNVVIQGQCVILDPAFVDCIGNTYTCVVH